MNAMKRTIIRAVTLLACATLAAPVARAGDVVAPPTEATPDAGGETYGTATNSIYNINAYDFVPATGDGANHQVNAFASRWCTSNCVLIAPVILPTGVVVNRIEIDACDTDAVNQVALTFFRQAALEGGLGTLAGVGTGAATASGCALFFAPTVQTIDNSTGSYFVQVTIGSAGTQATRFGAVRLYYKLQVSAAPAAATFPVDVPTTHPFFRFVEALARAGITGGCGTGTYCPDAPVTRGQMAVFLATALGLHFPN